MLMFDISNSYVIIRNKFLSLCPIYKLYVILS